MEKEFIPYEQAIELKQLGFDEPNYFLKWYDSKGLWFGSGLVTAILTAFSISSLVN